MAQFPLLVFWLKHLACTAIRVDEWLQKRLDFDKETNEDEIGVHMEDECFEPVRWRSKIARQKVDRICHGSKKRVAREG